MVMETSKQGYSSSYYSILGVNSDSSIDDIRRAYRKLAMQWHPDRWTRTPSLLGEAKRKFQQIQEAYSVLSDPNKRTLYDAGLYDPEEEEDEGFSDFVQEMVSLMAQVKNEEKEYNMEELQTMFTEMVQGFDPPWHCGCSPADESQYSKRTRLDPTNMMGNGFKLYETRGYCN
ncbi:hypothetical protein L6164_001607 [Bauhinia variegata]|uniref:Uncharacterized protein n=1 Tax=Bauhinia variegata TaxID=167791 RepID=A0ACB9QA47_BAUVA|nr:hypothetical protein L6164_001607 [Bauhinia variegata]